MIREIMATDDISWTDAREKFLLIVKSNRQGLFIATLPYKIGILTAVSAGVVSIPLLFHLETVLLFNEYFVTTGWVNIIMTKRTVGRNCTLAQ